MRTQNMINVDKAGFKIENTNPSFSKTVSWLHCYLEGEYNANTHYDMEWHGTISGQEKRAGQICFGFMCFFRRLLLSWQSAILVDLFASLWTI